MFNDFEIFIANQLLPLIVLVTVPFLCPAVWAAARGEALRALLTLAGMVVAGFALASSANHTQGKAEDAAVEQFGDIAHATVVHGTTSDFVDAIGGRREDAQPIEVTLQDGSEVVYLFTIDNDSGEVTLYLPNEAHAPEPESLR